MKELPRKFLAILILCYYFCKMIVYCNLNVKRLLLSWRGKQSLIIEQKLLLSEGCYCDVYIAFFFKNSNLNLLRILNKTIKS